MGYGWSNDGSYGMKEPEDWMCIQRFGPTNPSDFGTNYGETDGLLDGDSELPCIVSIVNATSRSKFAQRRYSNYVFGASWQWDDYKYVSYGPRQFHKADYALNDAGGAGGEAFGQLTPNTWATQDSIFYLCQASGFFLAMGIVFHVLAFLMGGFIWNYSKCCCDFGVCGFVFNAIVWSSLSLVCYMVSIITFAGLFFQGIEHDESNDEYVEEDERLEVVWSVGGALIITGMVFSAIAISLSSYQWAKDRQEAEDDKMEAAVEQAVRRVSGRGI